MPEQRRETAVILLSSGRYSIYILKSGKSVHYTGIGVNKVPNARFDTS